MYCVYIAVIHILLTLIYQDIGDSIQLMLCSHMCDCICERGSVLFMHASNTWTSKTCNSSVCG